MPNRDFVIWFILMKNILIKHSKIKKKEYKMYGSSNKGSPASEMELTQRDKQIKGVNQDPSQLSLHPSMVVYIFNFRRQSQADL